MRKIVVDIEDSGAVVVRITGGHLCKRELLRVRKAINLEYRYSVRAYRKQMIIKAHKEIEASAKPGVKEDDRITKEN